MNVHPSSAASHGPKPGGAVFIVDDNESLVELAATILKADGYEVQAFNDPHLLLAAVQGAAIKPAVLVTDYDMGTLNGLDLIVSVHKIDSAIKTVLLSGTIDGDFISRHTARVDRFLGKPYMPADLKRVVGEALRS
jgi:FixJ family two-component response regulator